MIVSESCHLRKLAKESPTPTMKQADACGFSVTPMLIHAGVLSSPYWFRNRLRNSWQKTSRLRSSKYPPLTPSAPMVDTTRSTMP